MDRVTVVSASFAIGKTTVQAEGVVWLKTGQVAALCG